MNIFYLGNNRTGWQVLKYLRERGEEVVGLAMHPEQRAKYWVQIVNECKMPKENIFDATYLHEKDHLEKIRGLKPDIAVSVLFGYLLRPSFLELFPRGVVNLHPGLLPYNRGAYTNVWPIVDGTPAGVTLHYVNEGIDTGDIIARKPVETAPVDTGETLYYKLEHAMLSLFKKAWPALKAGRAPRRVQPESGSSHKVADVDEIDEIDLGKSYQARYLLNILRARTFPPYRGAYFVSDKKKIYMELKLEESGE